MMLLVSNWKAYVADVKTAKSLVATGKRASTRNKIQLVIVPPAPFVGLFADGKTPPSKKLSFGAQDVSLVGGGAATGEITAAALAGLGLTHVIVGHSERRALGESDAMVLAKTQQTLSVGLTPILCIGERRRDPEAKYLHFLRSQIDAVFSHLSSKERARMVIAYEPLWAIGRNAADSIQPQDLQEMVLYIRKVLGAYMPASSAKKVPILYGGSVEPSNIRSLAGNAEVEGFLVGHASAQVDTYAGLIKALS